MNLIIENKNQAALRESEVRHILTAMIDSGEIISFSSVSTRAGVSRSYLYRHEEIADIIRESRVSMLSKAELRAELARERARNRK